MLGCPRLIAPGADALGGSVSGFDLSGNNVTPA